MPINSTHSAYDAALAGWLRARDVISGEDAIKAAGTRYLPRIESQTDDEYAGYKSRAAFFNATARTGESYVGLIFRRPPFVKIPDQTGSSPLRSFLNDCDMLGTSLFDYAKNITTEVIAVGRGGTLVDWEETEKRVYACAYAAESILNWRTERINGRNLPTLIVLSETTFDPAGDSFNPKAIPQLRVLKLVEGPLLRVDGKETTKQRQFSYQVELWQPKESGGDASSKEWRLVETRTPLRLGKPLPLIPFVFHGPRHSRPEIEKLPLADIIAVNLDHFRLDAEFKHGMHFTALPTPWVSGFDKASTLRIGASTAWMTETTGATAGFLEYTGQGLMTFERAMDRDERLMAVLGSRLLEPQKRVGETAQAIELRQSGENSILGNIAGSVSASLTQVLKWAYWWNSTEEIPDNITDEQVVLQLNTDYSLKGMSFQELTAIVAAWQEGAISRDTMFDLFRRGEILPDGRTNEEEAQKLKVGG